MKKETMQNIGFILLALFLVFLIMGRNNIVNSLEDVSLAEAQLQSMIQRRNDLLPSLVSAVAASMKHEEAVFAEITESQEKLAEAIQSASTAEALQADATLTSSLNKLVALIQTDYPELQTSEQFLNLQYEIAGSENRINIARLNYNEAVTTYNKYVRMFPGIVVARLFEYEPLPKFEANSTDVPKLDFGQ